MSTMVHSRHVIIITTTWNWGKPSLMNIPSQRFSVKSILILASDARLSLESGVFSWDAATKILHTFISPAQCCSGLLCFLFQIQILPPVQFSSRITKDRVKTGESREKCPGPGHTGRVTTTTLGGPAQARAPHPDNDFCERGELLPHSLVAMETPSVRS
jgi:hypothetical protein